MNGVKINTEGGRGKWNLRSLERLFREEIFLEE
jgi:hypothetical protein